MRIGGNVFDPLTCHLAEDKIVMTYTNFKTYNTSENRITNVRLKHIENIKQKSAYTTYGN
jgi:hypothetical protein